jgi:hypothetical protein
LVSSFYDKSRGFIGFACRKFNFGEFLKIFLSPCVINHVIDVSIGNGSVIGGVGTYDTAIYLISQFSH